MPIALALVLSPATLAADGPVAEPVRLAAKAFGQGLEVELRDLPRDQATDAARAAIREVHEIERLVEPDGEGERGLGALNRAPRGSAVELDPRLLALLARARDFCIWSRGAHGPLGGRLYALWGLRRAAAGLPRGPALVEAAASAACDRLGLDPQAGTAMLAPGSRADLWGFAEGFAVDRALAVLADRGSSNAWVEIGWVRRGAGGGAGSGGWRVELPAIAGLDEPLDELWIRDRAIVLLDASAQTLSIGGDLYTPYLDQTTGEPASGVQAVVVASELAVDAQGLAAAMMALGNRRGQALLGALRPLPSVLWLLGDGGGTPLLSAYQWSRLKTR